MAESKQTSSKRSIFGFTGVVAVAFVAILLYYWNQPTIISFDNGYPRRPLESTLTQQDVEDFKRDGFLIKRNFVQGEELSTLIEEAETIFGAWSPLDLVFRFAYAKLSMQVWRFSSPFAHFAFESSLPSISAQLLSEQGADASAVRLLKDAIFGYTQSGNGCGFHVDDKGFWPANDASKGVQFWLALSPMRISEGGGIRVANRSLTTDFSNECRDVIRNATCNMEQLSPTCNQKMMDASTLYDMDPGDLLVFDRMTWHRSEPFRVNSTAHKLRYTVRYMPIDAKGEGMLHPSVQQGEPFRSPYYPQVWPEALNSEVDAILKGLESDFAVSLIVKRMIMKKLGLIP